MNRVAIGVLVLGLFLLQASCSGASSSSDDVNESEQSEFECFDSSEIVNGASSDNVQHVWECFTDGVEGASLLAFFEDGTGYVNLYTLLWEQTGCDEITALNSLGEIAYFSELYGSTTEGIFSFQMQEDINSTSSVVCVLTDGES